MPSAKASITAAQWPRSGFHRAATREAAAARPTDTSSPPGISSPNRCSSRHAHRLLHRPAPTEHKPRPNRQLIKLHIHTLRTTHSAPISRTHSFSFLLSAFCFSAISLTLMKHPRPAPISPPPAPHPATCCAWRFASSGPNRPGTYARPPAPPPTIPVPQLCTSAPFIPLSAFSEYYCSFVQHPSRGGGSNRGTPTKIF